MSRSDRSRSLGEWMHWRGSRLSQSINPGLDRVRAAAEALHLEPARPLFIVAGTNGKGSTCAFLESLLRVGGLSTGVYGSPHLLDFRERIRVDGAMVDAEILCSAFERLAREPLALDLSVFEFDTLLAVQCFALAAVDAVILETGMGGRLDAVNVFDADVAVITSIDLDHQQWLGDTRDAIAREKAGIFRSDRVALCADPEPPRSLCEHARALGTTLECLDRDFRVETEGCDWYLLDSLKRGHPRLGPLVDGPLGGGVQRRNAATAVVAARRAGLGLTIDKVQVALSNTELPGRFQRLEAPVEIYLDVAHNPAAALALAERLATLESCLPRVAVMGAYRDKDIEGMFAAMDDQVDEWILCGLPGERGAESGELRDRLAAVAPSARTCENVADGYRLALDLARTGGRVVVFGSFETVAAALREYGHATDIHPPSG